ncbi:SPOR domain-containing protein [Oligella ureolytica]
MAAPRKRTARKTTSTRSRAPAKSGRSSSSFIAMGIIAGLAIAILFYTVFIRQDANLSKDNQPRYAHTPNQTDVLNPLPPRPRHETTTAPSVSQNQSASVPSVSEARSEPPLSIAESMAQGNAPQSATIPTKPAEKPKATTQAKTPSSQTAPTKATAPKPAITEDAIGNLITQNQTPVKPTANVGTAPKDTADHVGALIKTMPSAAPNDTPTANKTNNTTTAIITKQNNALNAVPEKTIALSPAPSKEKPFYLQAGPYKNENDADSMRAQLLLLGHSTASTHKALVNNQTVYRVRVGPYTSSTEFEKAQKSLETAKLKLIPIH